MLKKNKKAILRQNLMLKYINSHKTNLKWIPQNHVKYDKNTQNVILLFITCLKYNKFKIKIPKFVIFEIINFILSY